MVNKVVFQGRLTKDIEVKSTPSGNNVANFTLANNKPYNKDHDHPESNFINFVAWGKTADFISNYFKKGDQMVVSGRLDSRNWEDQSGSKRVSVSVIVEEVHFCERKTNNTDSSADSVNSVNDVLVDEDDDDLPY